MPGFDTPEFLAAEQELKKWVDEGLINPDFATLDTANWKDPFVQGKGGIIIDVDVRATQLFDLFKQKNPKDPDKVADGRQPDTGRRPEVLRCRSPATTTCWPSRSSGSGPRHSSTSS